MKSNVDEILDRLDTWRAANLKASGVLIVANTQDAIREDGLIRSGEMIGTWDYRLSEDSVVTGTPIDEPDDYRAYPVLQNDGFTHAASGEIVGGTHFAERGADNSRRELKEAWKRKP